MNGSAENVEVAIGKLAQRAREQQVERVVVAGSQRGGVEQPGQPPMERHQGSGHSGGPAREWGRSKVCPDWRDAHRVFHLRMDGLVN
jgi:hypothetical protein